MTKSKRTGPEVYTQGVPVVPYTRPEYNLAYQRYNEVLWADVNDPISALGAAFEELERQLRRTTT